MNKDTIDRIKQFAVDRDWLRFHTPSNLAKSIVIEASELLECFQWNNDYYNLIKIKEELADVLIYCRYMLEVLNLDEDVIVNEKLDINETKYPIDIAKGNATKYTEYTWNDFVSDMKRSVAFK